MSVYYNKIGNEYVLVSTIFFCYHVNVSKWGSP